MNQLELLIQPTLNWIKEDYASHPVRFVLEVLSWAMSIGCAVWMGLTLPNPPFLILYPLFITQCAVFGWAAWTRGSTGMVANYLLLVTIDSIAFVRLICL